MKQERTIGPKKRSPCWNVMGAVVVTQNCTSIPKSEQEFHLWSDRDRIVKIDCSHIRWITKLKRNPLFKVDRVVKNTGGRVLEVSGSIDEKLLTIRRKHRTCGTR